MIPSPLHTSDDLGHYIEATARLRGERDELAAALTIAVRFLSRMRNGYARLNGKETVLHWSNLDQSIAEVETLIAVPGACLQLREEAKDAEIRQLKNMLAEAGLELLTHRHIGPIHSAHEIARYLGYEGELAYDKVERFLASVSVEEATT